jgi:membrane protein DedA with SNARE-associated domain
MDNIGEYLLSYGYIFLFFYSLGGGFVGLVVASIFSQDNIGANPLDINLVILTAFVSNFLGDNLLVYMSKYQKKEFLPYIKKYSRKIALCRIWIYRYEYSVIFIQKFVYGIKTLIPMAIGLSGYNVKKFIFINFFASLFWATSVGYASYFAGAYIKDFMKYFDNSYLPFVILIAIILAFLYFISKITEKKMNKS